MANTKTYVDTRNGISYTYDKRAKVLTYATPEDEGSEVDSPSLRERLEKQGIPVKALMG